MRGWDSKGGSTSTYGRFQLCATLPGVSHFQFLLEGVGGTFVLFAFFLPLIPLFLFQFLSSQVMRASFLSRELSLAHCSLVFHSPLSPTLGTNPLIFGDSFGCRS